MQDINWDALSLDELKDIQKKATKAIASFEDRKKAEALAALQAKADEMGFSLKELVGDGKGKTITAPKYAHPENPALTWTGRGRQPGWFKDALANGASEQDMLIQ